MFFVQLPYTIGCVMKTKSFWAQPFYSTVLCIETGFEICHAVSTSTIQTDSTYYTSIFEGCCCP